MRPQEIIAKKRDGENLSEAEIKAFIQGVCDETWADYQTSALIMAMFTRGLNLDEQTYLTQNMLHSGEVLDFSDLEKPKADKHSTGGVGDKTSLIIAPLAAACGLAVPMISGRGLGHTGGTLDKLESIPGYNVNLSTVEFKRVIKICGFAMCGQTPEIAPADKKIYALRDATATVPYIPLIVASIMSKKLAEGLDALVLDVKTGNGAFMETFADSVKLAEAMVQTGESCGVKTNAVISDMSQPLGKFVGNALEVFECLKILRGEADSQMAQTLELSVELTARILLLAKIADSIENAKKLCHDKLENGEALEKFRPNIELQGGNPTICDSPEIMLEDVLKIPVTSLQSGFIGEIDTKTVGNAVSEIGGGRMKIDDEIDFAVGFECEKKIGDEVREGESLGILYCRDESQANRILGKLQNAYQISEEKPERIDLVRFIVSA
jgi:pyrimidine-nucleoside phosphorylase